MPAAANMQNMKMQRLQDRQTHFKSKKM